MRSGRYLTINLPAQLETIFMAFIFCKISKLKYKLILKILWSGPRHVNIGILIIMTYWAPELLRAFETDLNLSSSRSEILRQVSYSPAYHFYRINSSLLLINSFMLPSPTSPPPLSLEIIDNKIPPEQKLHPNLAAPAVFRGMIFCFFFLKIQFPVKSVLVLLSPGLVSLLCLLSPSPSWQW